MQANARRMIGRTGVATTALGFGGASIGNLHLPVAADEARAAILAGYRGGIRYFDSAPLYGAGEGERRMGEALAGVPRDDLVVSTKVGHRLTPQPDMPADRDRLSNRVSFDYGYDATMRSLEGSLNRLGLERVDIAFIHDIDPYNHGTDQPKVFRAAMDGAWRALVALRDSGVVRAIGVGVNDVAVCEACLREADIDCFLLAARYTLLDTKALATLLPACQARGVGVVLGAPFNSGLLARGAASAATYNHVVPPDDVLHRVAAIERIGAGHGVALMAAALQFPLAHEAIASVLPGIRSAIQGAACLAAIATDIPNAFWAELRHSGLIDPAAPTPDQATHA